MAKDDDLGRAAVKANPPDPIPPPSARCPYCGISPAPISAAMIMFPTAAGNLTAVIFQCGNENCRRIFSIAPTGMMPGSVQPSIVPAATVPPNLKSLADKIKAGNLRKN